ncbi:hypothetical protein LSTR_LSTR004376 [Laodelphax striatellus]|uniref:EF-hand domain-containing protein n=1 Tax=Laodelphax striatellus TaxID=195883 RepID=A0A482X943_LAOST|nr:hypothetical protein LSTR_LSTR004376 [Laodelphax striatellus]
MDTKQIILTVFLINISLARMDDSLEKVKKEAAAKKDEELNVLLFEMFDVDKDGLITNHDLEECEKSESLFNKVFENDEDGKKMLKSLRMLVENKYHGGMNYSNFKSMVIDNSKKLRDLTQEETEISTILQKLNLEWKYEYSVEEVAEALNYDEEIIFKRFKKQGLVAKITLEELIAAYKSNDDHLPDNISTKSRKLLKKLFLNGRLNCLIHKPFTDGFNRMRKAARIGRCKSRLLAYLGL